MALGRKIRESTELTCCICGYKMYVWEEILRASDNHEEVYCSQECVLSMYPKEIIEE